jgi:hypothetical protein
MHVHVVAGRGTWRAFAAGLSAFGEGQKHFFQVRFFGAHVCDFDARRAHRIKDCIRWCGFAVVTERDLAACRVRSSPRPVADQSYLDHPQTV